MKIIHVTHLKKVDPSRYTEGDIFLSEKEKAILHRGRLDPLVSQSDLKGYVKKKDVQKLIEEALTKGAEK